MLDPRRLVVLREFAAEGTIARAAERLSLTPSAVSQHLALLQRETGVPLFRHEGRRLELTDVGRLLVDRADTVISTLESVDAELAEAAETVQGTVRIAAFQTAARFLVLPVLDRLTRAHPQLDPRLVEVEAEPAIPELVRGGLDVVVAEEYPNAPRPHVPGTVRRDLLADEMRIAIPADMRVPRGKALDPARLADAPWVTAREGTAYAEMTVGLCRSVGGFEPAIQHRANDLQLMLDLVTNRGCVAIVPALGTRERQPGVETRSISGERLTRTIFALVRASDAARPSTAAVLEMLTASHH